MSFDVIVDKASEILIVDKAVLMAMDLACVLKHPSWKGLCNQGGSIVNRERLVVKMSYNNTFENPHPIQGSSYEQQSTCDLHGREEGVKWERSLSFKISNTNTIIAL